MSNRNDFDDDFSFDDDPFSDSSSDDFGFDDDDLGFEDDSGFDDLNDEDEFLFDNGEEEAAGGPNRTFIILAAIMIILFLLGLAAVVFLALSGNIGGPSEVQLTATRIVEINLTREVQATETAVQAQAFVVATETAAQEEIVAEQTLVIVQATETAVRQAAFIAGTQTAEAVPTDTPTPSETPADVSVPEELTPPAVLLTEDAVTAQAQTAQAQLGQPGLGTTLTPGLSTTDILQTATALAQTLSPTTPIPGDPGVEPTRVIFPPPGGDQLPETGLFDGFASTQGMGMLLLMAFGLVGVIVVSRRMRK